MRTAAWAPLTMRGHADPAGRREQAQEHFTTAMTMYREMDMRFWLEAAEAGIQELE